MAKTNFEERKANRIAAYERLAEKNAEEANERRETVHKIQSFIPLGQPILVGHHSEKRHRSDLNKIEKNIHKSVEADGKAKYYEKKAKAAATNTNISSDDPEAVRKLKDRINGLIEANEEMKKANLLYKKNGSLEDADLSPVTKKAALNNLEYQADWQKDPQKRKPFTHFNTPEINRLKKRLKKLEELEKMEYQEKEINGVNIIIDPEDNRVKIVFKEIPNEITRKRLKRNGFKWSPRNKAWQRMISSHAVYIAKDIVTMKDRITATNG